MDIDTTVARAVLSTALLERALHGDGTWTLAWGPMEVPISRTVVEDGVTFRAEFPEVCHLTPPYPVALLKIDGEPISAKTIEFPGEGPFVVEWTLRARVIETVA